MVSGRIPVGPPDRESEHVTHNFYGRYRISTMGNNSSQGQPFTKEKKSETVDATLYYFSGRGRADQVRQEIIHHDFISDSVDPCSDGSDV